MMKTGIKKVLFVGHEATRTGAPIGFLSLMGWLREAGLAEPVIWLKNGGALTAEHEALGPTAVGADGGKLAGVEGIHLAYLNTVTLGAQAEALDRAGVPVVCHAHEMDFELEATGAVNLARLARSTRLFVACSEAVKASLIRCAGVEEERVVVVPECVDVERALRQAKEPVEEGVRVAGERLVCGMGTVSWRKGVDLFLRVVAELGEGWRGVWIGDLESGPDAARVKHDLRVLGLEGRVRFTGSLPNPHAVLGQADVFCLTSREDPYPLAMVEAAALGKPVIGFRGSGGVEEFAAQGGAVTVDYGDTKAMARRAEELAGGGEDPRRLETARRLCDPDVVGRAVAESLERTALEQPAAFTESLRGQLAAACGAQTRVEVTIRRVGGNRTAGKSWEGAAEGEGEVRLAVDEEGMEGGEWEVVLAPKGRSVVMRGVRVRRETVVEGYEECVSEVRSGGRVARLRRGGEEWLLLDGQGRLVIRLRGWAGGGRLVVSWRMTADVKRALEAEEERREPGRRGWLERLGLKKGGD